MQYSELIEGSRRHPKDTSGKYDPKDITGLDPNIINNVLTKLNAFIDKNCQPWLTEMGRLSSNKMVYRGINNAKKVYFTKPVRTQRLPRDSMNHVHARFNDIIKQAGKKANRNNSIFVTGSKQGAMDYGIYTYAIFPMGNFNYTWHPDYRDWTSEISNDRHMEPKAQNRIIKRLKGDDGSLKRAIKSPNEIMIKCRRAVYIAYPMVDALLMNRSGTPVWPEDWREEMQQAFISGNAKYLSNLW